MKDLKKKVTLQELSKEEATNTYGGAAKKMYFATVVKGNKFATIVVYR